MKCVILSSPIACSDFIKFNGILIDQRCPVFEQVLQRIQEKILQQQYVMTLHAEEEMEDDHLSIGDIE